MRALLQMVLASRNTNLCILKIDQVYIVMHIDNYVSTIQVTMYVGHEVQIRCNRTAFHLWQYVL